MLVREMKLTANQELCDHIRQKHNIINNQLKDKVKIHKIKLRPDQCPKESTIVWM